MRENELSELVIGSAIKVHKSLGPGLLESAYQACLYYELTKEGLDVEKEKAIPLVYEEVKLDCGYRLDLIVENRLIIEIKAMSSLTDVHMAQILTYLKLTECKLGLLMNFNEKLIKNGIRRVVNNF